MMRKVVVFVPVPQKAVHDVFMSKPGNEFHGKNGGNSNCGIGEKIHLLKSFVLYLDYS